MEDKLNITTQRLKECREKLNLSYQDLSNATGFSKSVLQRYETGAVAKLPLSRLAVIAKALRTTPAYLMGWDEEIDIKKEIALIEEDDLHKTFINLFRQLTPEHQDLAVAFLQTMRDKQALVSDAEQKNEEK